MTSLKQFKTVAQEWLAFQCRLLAGVSNAVVVLGEPEKDNYAPAASWSGGDTATPALAETVKLALSRRQPIFGELTPTGSRAAAPMDVAALPLLIEGKLVGAVAFEVARRPNMHQQALVSMLQLGVAWFEFLLRQSDQQRVEHLERTLALMAAALQSEAFQSSATAVATTLATQLGCERVSVGLRSRRHCRVVALSHSARFEKRANLIRDIEGAMDEALEQDTLLAHPATDERATAITVAQRELGRQHGGNAVLTVPLVAERRLIGAITLERAADRPFDSGIIEQCKQAAALIGPLLEGKRLATQSLLKKTGHSCAGLAARLLGAGHYNFKLIAVVLAAVLTWLCTATGMYQVTSPASLEGTVQRVIVAPRDGFVGSAHAAAGDVVDDKQLLATLDDKDLQLERLRWESQRAQLRKKYREVFAQKDRAEATILDAQIEQADAQIALIDEQLARGQLLAPFAGVIVKGDLQHSLGAPVKRGDVLFEVAPLNGYRVIVEVDERAIAAVDAGQRGQLVLTANPQQPLPFAVEKITPVTTAAEGRNSFRVEAQLDDASPLLRPGMRGVAKIDVEPRKRIWIWTHSLIDWLRLKTWSWLP